MLDPDGHESRKGNGHHWIPFSKFTGELRNAFTEEALDWVNRHGISVPKNYNHANDTWHDVTHTKYNKAIPPLLRSYRSQMAGRRKLTPEHVAQLIRILKGNLEPSKITALNGKKLNLPKRALETATRYAAGFHRSDVLAKILRDKLSCKPKSQTQFKRVLRYLLNDQRRPGLGALTRTSRSVIKAYNDLPERTKEKMWSSAAKQVARRAGITKASAFLPRGVRLQLMNLGHLKMAYEGKTYNSKRAGQSGVAGLVAEVALDQVFAQEIETVVAPIVVDCLDSAAMSLINPVGFRRRAGGDQTLMQAAKRFMREREDFTKTGEKILEKQSLWDLIMEMVYGKE